MPKKIGLLKATKSERQHRKLKATWNESILIKIVMSGCKVLKNLFKQ